MYHILRHQPFKGLYLSYQLISTLFIRLPIWVLFSIPKSWRPRGSWTIKRVVLVRLYRQLAAVTSLAGPIRVVPNHLAITPGVGVKGVWVEPVPDLITGEVKTWASVSSVSSIRVPGYWIHKAGSSIEVAAPPMPGEKVVYALHGGGYVRLSAHPTDPTAVIARDLLKYCDSVHRVFSIEYRLSATAPFKAAHPFPAALLDALAGYNYLINVVGISSDDIIIEGDSAGGNLALALTRYLVEHKDTLGLNLPTPPHGIILLSPWCDLGGSHLIPGSSAYTCLGSDYIDVTQKPNYSVTAYLGPHGIGAASVNRYVSPSSLHPSMSINFTGFPRTFIVGGGAEVLIDEIRELKDRMIKDLGKGYGVKNGEGKVTYYEAPDGVHDYVALPWFEPERGNTLKEIATWVSA